MGHPSPLASIATVFCLAVVTLPLGSLPALAAIVQSSSTWTDQSPGVSGILSGISCPSASTCFAVGKGNGNDIGFTVILATTNGGGTWTDQSPGVNGSLSGISCPSTSTCFAVGWDGTPNATILATTNGGGTWTDQILGVSGTLSGISCPSTSTCFAVGGDGTGFTHILATTNGGGTWTDQILGVSVSLSGISCPSTSTCFAVGYGVRNGISLTVILDTTNGTWTDRSPGGLGSLSGISCPSTSTCFAVGWNGTGNVIILAYGASAGGSLPQITITNVKPGNGSVQVYFTTPAPYTSYVVTASQPVTSLLSAPAGNNRIPAPAAPAISTPPPGGPSPVTSSPATLSGLIEDCHQAYSISVTPYAGNLAGPTATWETWVRPSGIVQTGPPKYVVILLDGISSAQPGFDFNPYNPTQDGTPSYCPEAFIPPSGVLGAPSWPASDFWPAPNGPAEFFAKWNFYDPADNRSGNDPLKNSNSTPRTVDNSATPTNSFMLDAVAAQGAIILPFSYMGAKLTSPSQFHFPVYTSCNSTPGAGGFGCNNFNTANGNDDRKITQDADALNTEVASVQQYLKPQHIIILGHSQGGLIAWDWWQAHPSSGKTVTAISLDSPINGVVTPLPPGYPDYSKRLSQDPPLRAQDDSYSDPFYGDPFRFVGTWGDSPVVPLCLGKVTSFGCVGQNYGSIAAYGDPTTDEPLQHELLVTGTQCNNTGNTTNCAPPVDHVSGCSVTQSSPDWVKADSHFIVKFCPDDVSFFNGVLRLSY